jgi:hypothetical protein
MAPTSSVRLTSVLFTAFLCFVIVMQILGVATSFWAPGFDSDPLGSPLSEGLSLIPPHVTLSTAMSPMPYHEATVRRSSVLLDEIPFRPPSHLSLARSFVSV